MQCENAEKEKLGQKISKAFFYSLSMQHIYDYEAPLIIDLLDVKQPYIWVGQDRECATKKTPKKTMCK